MAIPFVREHEFEYGVIERIAPGLRRITARNPNAFTFHGTGVFIIGDGDVAIVDPGPNDSAHVDALLEGLKGETVSHILITHTHNDHSPAAAPVKSSTGAKTYAFGAHGSGQENNVRIEEGGDLDFLPDVEVRHGDVIEGTGWRVECVYTPGHTSNHMCFSLPDSGILFTGDHVMGWSTSVIVPPDGNMAAYFASLELLLARDDDILIPTHGPAITTPKPFVQSFIDHRNAREVQIETCLSKGIRDVRTMVKTMYRNVDERLHPAAAMSVLAHLQHMVDTGRARYEGTMDANGIFHAP